MSSFHSVIKQLVPFTYYIVSNDDGYMLRTLTLGDTRFLDSGTTLSDMGKTVVIDGYVYRKVQIAASVSGDIGSGKLTGYICINSNSAPLLDGNDQNISKLN
jgi:hypothetical protein